MSEPLPDDVLRDILRAAGDVGALAASGGPFPADLESRLTAWREEPQGDVDGLDAEQVKALAVDAIRLAQVRALRDDAALLAVDGALADARGAPIAVLSGAGISVDAGFRTFRGAGGEGLWERVDPMVLASVDGFESDPARSMRWYCDRRTRGLRAVATLAHAAIAAAQAAQGEAWAGTHTQNVDGLHEAAGSRGVNRIHGSLWVWRDRRTMDLVFDPSDDFGDIPLDGRGEPTVRPGVVLFGDYVTPRVYERAIREIRRAGVVIVVGTSAQVSTLWPLLHAAHEHATLLVDVNPERSPVTDELGALHVPLPSGAGIPLVLETLGALDPAATERLARTPRPPLRDRLPALRTELLDDGA